MSIKWNKTFLYKLEELDSQRLQPEFREMYSARSRRDLYRRLETPLNETQSSDITHLEYSEQQESNTSIRAKTAPAMYKQKCNDHTLPKPILEEASLNRKDITNSAANVPVDTKKTNDTLVSKKSTTADPRKACHFTPVKAEHKFDTSNPEATSIYQNEAQNKENLTTVPTVSTLTPFSQPTPPKAPSPLKSTTPRIEKPTTRSPKVLSQSLRLTPNNKQQYFEYLQKSWSDQIEYLKDKEKKEKDMDKARRLESESEILTYIEKEKEQRLKKYNEAKSIMKENYYTAIKRREHNGMEPSSFFMEDRKVMYYTSKEQMARDLQKQIEEKTKKQKAERELDIEEGRRKFEEIVDSNKKQDEMEEILRKSKKRNQLNLLDTQMKEKRKLEELRKTQEHLELSKLNLVTIEPKGDSIEVKREKARKLFEEQSTAYFNFLQTKELTKQNLKDFQQNENIKFQQQLHKEQLRKLKKREEERKSLRESWNKQENEKNSSRSKENAEEISLYATSLF